MNEASRKSPTTFGWSEAKRRDAIIEIHAKLMADHSLTTTEAAELLARATGSGLNTVQGWISQGSTRSPPQWPVLDVLRYRTGLATPEALKPTRGK